MFICECGDNLKIVIYLKSGKSKQIEFFVGFSLAVFKQRMKVIEGLGNFCEERRNGGVYRVLY